MIDVGVTKDATEAYDKDVKRSPHKFTPSQESSASACVS